MPRRSAARRKALAQLKSQLRYGQGLVSFGALANFATVTVGTAPTATGGVDYLVNRMSYSGTMVGTPSNRAFMWAIMKKTESSDVLVDLNVEDDVLDAQAEGKLFHVKGPVIWSNAGARPPRINAKLTDIPMRSGDELHFYFENVGGGAFTTGMSFVWAGWLSYQV